MHFPAHLLNQILPGTRVGHQSPVGPGHGSIAKVLVPHHFEIFVVIDFGVFRNKYSEFLIKKPMKHS